MNLIHESFLRWIHQQRYHERLSNYSIYDAYYNGDHTVDIPPKVKAALESELGTVNNYCRVVVDSAVEYISSGELGIEVKHDGTNQAEADKAERLLYDVLGGDFESGACEFEHTVTPELVDSICILLGHPKTCPHGSPIPQGKCCKESRRTAQSSVVPLVKLEVGQSARVAYINCKSDQQLHKIDSLCIRPGTIVTLHQRYPTYVVECEGSNIAMDEQIASNICVWKGTDPL